MMIPDWMRLVMLVSEVEAHAAKHFPGGEYRVEMSRFNDGEIRATAVHYTPDGREVIKADTGSDSIVHRVERPPDLPTPEYSKHPHGPGRCWDIVEASELTTTDKVGEEWRFGR